MMEQLTVYHLFTKRVELSSQISFNGHSTNNGLNSVSRLNMRDNSKCITFSLAIVIDTRTWRLFRGRCEANSGTYI